MDKDNDAIRKVTRMAYDESLELQKNITGVIFKQYSSLLIIRSFPMKNFEKFLSVIKDINPHLKLTIIGKDGDEKILDKYYPNQYEVLKIDGQYSEDKIQNYNLKIENYDTIVMFSMYVPSGDYMNIYRLANSISNIKTSGIIADAMGNFVYIDKLKRWFNALSVIENLSKWYAEE